MSGEDESAVVSAHQELFARVAAILEMARGNVVRAVNSNMVVAYWLIGREIVETIQEGEETAEYGRGVLQRLFSPIFQAFADRLEIRNPAGSISLPPRPVEIWNPAGSKTGHDRVTGENTSVETSQLASLFAPELTWSHYPRSVARER